MKKAIIASAAAAGALLTGTPRAQAQDAASQSATSSAAQTSHGIRDNWLLTASLLSAQLPGGRPAVSSHTTTTTFDGNVTESSSYTPAEKSGGIGMPLTLGIEKTWPIGSGNNYISVLGGYSLSSQSFTGSGLNKGVVAGIASSFDLFGTSKIGLGPTLTYDSRLEGNFFGTKVGPVALGMRLLLQPKLFDIPLRVNLDVAETIDAKRGQAAAFLSIGVPILKL
ncbi:MAG: hypothetical protein WDO70_05340 [Alphaproteobacteria bacterium]